MQDPNLLHCYVCVCVCVCVCVYIYIYIYICVCVCVYIHTHTYHIIYLIVYWTQCMSSLLILVATDMFR